MAYQKSVMSPFQIYGASRTDAGYMQSFKYVPFKPPGAIPVENIPRAMIAHIPKGYCGP